MLEDRETMVGATNNYLIDKVKEARTKIIQ